MESSLEKASHEGGEAEMRLGQVQGLSARVAELTAELEVQQDRGDAGSEEVEVLEEELRVLRVTVVMEAELSHGLQVQLSEMKAQMGRAGQEGVVREELAAKVVELEGALGMVSDALDAEQVRADALGVTCDAEHVRAGEGHEKTAELEGALERVAMKLEQVCEENERLKEEMTGVQQGAAKEILDAHAQVQGKMHRADEEKAQREKGEREETEETEREASKAALASELEKKERTEKSKVHR